MEMEKWSIMTNHFMKESGLKIKEMEKDITILVMVKSTTASGRMI